MKRTQIYTPLAVIAAALLGVLVLPGAASAYCPSPPFEHSFSEQQLYEQCLREESRERERTHKEMEEGNAFEKGFAKGQEGQPAGQEGQPAAPPYRPPSRAPSHTSVSVSVHGCKYWPHVAVNGKKNIGGNITWVLYGWHHARWVRKYSRTDPLAGGFAYGEGRPGVYRFSARFLGDENILPSRSSASAGFTIRHC